MDEKAAKAAPAAETKIPSRILLVAYPKVVFLYPTLLTALLAAVVLNFQHQPLDAENKLAAALSVFFLGILGANLVVLGFDFPRGTSLTLFFFCVALVLGGALVVTFYPNVLPAVTHFLAHFRPLANASFYWSIVALLTVIYLGVLIVSRFDYWEVRPNELLHHHGFLSDLERFPSPHLRIDKEINDVFEYMLLRSGRLILQSTEDRRTIILDNIPFIGRKEDAITRMLGALQVQLRTDNDRADG